MLYSLYETQKKIFQPLAQYLGNSIEVNKVLNANFITNPLASFFNARNELLYEFFRTYDKPEFNIEPLVIDNKVYHVEESIEIDKTFCELRRFTKKDEDGRVLNQPVLLIVAPLSGHYATLLRDTVTASLQDYEVYITDWKNCRDISIQKGDFGFDDYVFYLQDYIDLLTKKYGNINLIAVCQPTVPVLAASAYSSKQGRSLPNKIVLMGGPIDTRESPTGVNNYAMNYNLDWFENHVIYRVPIYYDGVARKVYPGFLQYMGFLSMNMKKHTEAHIDFFNHLLEGANLAAEKHKKFYQEYNAVMDLPAKYYLETLERVFLDQKLAKGTLEINGDLISLLDIKNVSMLTIEGAKDDISGPNQTHAAYNLCKNIKDKEKITFQNVGHYGIFSGSSWRKIVYPTIRDWLSKK